MMDDVISRQTAIEAILSIGHKAELSDGDAVIRVSAVNYVLRIMPSAQPEPKWIPCSERLPEKGVDVLCCRNNKTMDIMHFNPVSTTNYPKGFSMVWDAFSWRQDNVIAWMPLPEPYREDGEADESD